MTVAPLGVSSAARSTLAVVSGLSDTGMVPRFWLPSPPPGWQSLLRPCEFVVRQDMPSRAPRSHVPVRGFDGVGVPEPVFGTQTGQGCVALPVRNVSEPSGMTAFVMTPVSRFSVPLTGGAPGALLMRFTTQLLVPAFGIGNGVPKKQPGAVQS